MAKIEGMEHIRHYLYGKRFTVRTDHAALSWLLSFKNPECQMAKWIERLHQYDFEVVHRSENIHT